MAYQLGDIADKVRNRVQDSGFGASMIRDFLNDTINDVFNEYRLPFMETTQDYTVSTSTSSIGTLPTDFTQAIDLLYTGPDAEFLVPYKDIREIDLLYPDADDTSAHPAGNPLYWYFYGRTLRVYPLPDEAYTLTLRYYKKPAMLADDTDVPAIPSQFEELLVVGAATRVMQVKDNYDQAAILENKYGELLQKLVMQNAQGQTGSPTTMRINKYQVSRTSF